MSNVNDVPFPYHTKVKRFIDETGEVEMEQLTEMGNWMSFKVDEARFRAMAGGSDDFLTEFNQDWDDFTDELWEPDGVQEFREIEAMFDEYYPVTILDEMPHTTTYGDISPRTAAYVVRDLLKRAMPSMLMEKFGRNLKNNFSANAETAKNKSKVIKFRRYSVG